MLQPFLYDVLAFRNQLFASLQGFPVCVFRSFGNPVQHGLLQCFVRYAVGQGYNST